METPEHTGELSQWLRILARVDFVAAVALTVVAPLVLLARALRTTRREELWALLRYWRASSLLMVTVYAMRDGDSLRRAFCQRVVNLRLAADDLAQLGPGVAPAQPAQAPTPRPVVSLFPAVFVLTLLAVLLWNRLRRRRVRG